MWTLISLWTSLCVAPCFMLQKDFRGGWDMQSDLFRRPPAMLCLGNLPRISTEALNQAVGTPTYSLWGYGSLFHVTFGPEEATGMLLPSAVVCLIPASLQLLQQPSEKRAWRVAPIESEKAPAWAPPPAWVNRLCLPSRPETERHSKDILLTFTGVQPRAVPWVGGPEGCGRWEP